VIFGNKMVHLASMECLGRAEIQCCSPVAGLLPVQRRASSEELWWVRWEPGVSVVVCRRGGSYR